MFLLESNTLSVLSPLLTSEFYKVQMPTLRCFANMCYKNPTVCAAVAAGECYFFWLVADVRNWLCWWFLGWVVDWVGCWFVEWFGGLFGWLG